MKLQLKFLFLTLILIFNFGFSIDRNGIRINQQSVLAQNNIFVWSDISESNFIIKGERRITPVKYRTIKSNSDELKSILNNAPFELSDRATYSPLIIELPMPDGSFSKFYVTEYSMMEPGLSVQFPEIKTYNIKGIDDPFAVGKIDITESGFHGMVLTPRGDYYIDPYSSDEKEIYISYYKSEFIDKQQFECLVNEERVPDFMNGNNSILTGQQLRTYRLACAATVEYTAFFGGTVNAGLSAVTTAINRVNGIYERDFSVRMTLVANNNLIIYTSTDPYTNNNGPAMLGQNQSNLDAVILPSNYDIGHVFSTGGGGIAGLGVVCLAGNKARGVTGLPSPTGDPFYIDYVAHEMGHQYGGNHTFNSVSGGCSGNRNGSTAWEPGSGSTIMPYAGLCDADDLQSNSDDYFHTGSVSEIVSYTQSGSGSTCPVTTNTGNTPPTVSVPAGGFTIPINTPFALTGSATDPNNPNSLTYCWEEYDVGPSGSPNSPSGNAPIFRSFKPDTSSTRTFPKLSNLLNNSQTIGEILPSYGRSLNFRLTVRDNNAGGGGIEFNTVAFNVSAGAGPFLVTQPNTNITWTSPLPATVTWNVANTSASPVSCANVNIKLSTNGGNTFPITLVSNTPNDGSESIIPPAVNTSLARVKVEAAGNIFFDISNVNFTINISNIPVITHSPLPDQSSAGWPASVAATVTSGSGIDSSWVVWYKNSIANKKQFKLNNTSGINYSAFFNSLNSDVIIGDIIYYKILAQSSSASHEKDSTALYSFNITDPNLNEGFLTETFPPSGWNIVYTGTLYWSRSTVSSFGIGTGSAKFNFYDSPDGTEQSLITKTFTSTSAGDSLKFDNAYAPHVDGSTDSLEILISSNGGANYSTLVRLWGNNVDGNLNTRGAISPPYTPPNAQWGRKKYSLPEGTNKIKFRARSGSGNNLFLDTIRIARYIAPEITHTPILDQSITSWPVNLNAVIISANPLDSSWVVWYKNIAANTKEFSLINTSGNNYSASFNSLNSDVSAGDVIYYKIYAQNNTPGHEMDSTALYSFNILDQFLNEGFFSETFPPAGWNLEYANTLYWSRSTVSSFGIGSGSVKFNFYDSPDGTDQSLVTKVFESTSVGDSLKFDNAYAPHLDGSTDSLEILISSNGGTSYSTLVRLWGNNVDGNLNTRGAISPPFTPFNAQWGRKNYILPQGTNKIKFRARSGSGNNLFLDSIRVVKNTVPAMTTIKVIPQGFYNISTSKLNRRDTVRIYLRNITAPYAIVDSGSTVIDSVSFSGSLIFNTAPSGNYYIIIKHRNCVETWSKAGGEVYTFGLPFSYDFTSAVTQAYGDNLILKGGRYCIYSSDVNQDYNVDVVDLSMIDNDASNFVSGYTNTDLTGDNQVDAGDLAVADDNSANFISRQAPPGALMNMQIAKNRNPVVNQKQLNINDKSVNIRK